MSPIRYREPKQRSAELLRLVVAHMGRHPAACNPLTFALWYEYVAGINPKLNAAVDAAAANGSPLDDAAVATLFGNHIAPADDETLGRIGLEMQQLMSNLAESASHTGRRAGTFGAQLGGLRAALGTNDTGALGPWLEEVAASTADMKQSVETLQARVAVGENEIRRLRADLDRACNEALLDPLTGILNRKGFDRRLADALDQPAGGGGAAHHLVMFDIDHFKSVNDTHGHVVGDRVIQAVAEILRTTVTDPSHAVTRYGGEEFAMLLPQSSRKQCTELAEAVRARTKAMRIRSRKTQEVLLSITISGGATEARPDDDAATLVARADAALYASKSAGRDRLTLA
jgi:diguanylate cyclase